MTYPCPVFSKYVDGWYTTGDQGYTGTNNFVRIELGRAFAWVRTNLKFEEAVQSGLDDEAIVARVISGAGRHEDGNHTVYGWRADAFWGWTWDVMEPMPTHVDEWADELELL